MRRGLPGSTSVVIAALSIVLGVAACGSDDAPGADRSDPVLDTSPPAAVASSTEAPSATVSGSTATPAEVTDTESTAESTTAPTTSAATATTVPEPGISEADVTELEQQLDEIDSVLVDLETQLAQD